MLDDLHQIGWKAFQDLCMAIATEVLQRPVQTFMPSNDGGRDGAFIGTWEGAPDRPENKSTIQCKHIGKAGVSLTLSRLKDELPKAERLAAKGLAHDYIIITNARVSGGTDEKISDAFRKVGVKQCRVFGGEWVSEQLRSRAALRMLVPRVYNLADLGEFINGRAYTQARHLLSAMGDDLRCFVTTDAHRRSVAALQNHRFVLLLGDPASGKSTIAAILALGALDGGSHGAIRITSPDQLDQWDPDKPQFLWVDDAFGSNQLEAAKLEGWNSQLPMLRAAVKHGARVVFTSRNYIWEAARRSIRTSQFPLLQESQVVIDVQGLTKFEQAKILYNHVRLGDQPAAFRQRLKPFLPVAATVPEFLPETARRLGSSEFTGRLSISAAGVKDFIERPLDFLREVLERLDEASASAIALIFMHGTRGVPSPISSSTALDTVGRLTGAKPADIARALEAMNGSLTLLVEHDEGNRWTYRHPTIADAYALLVADSPELVEIYAHGAKPDRLLADVFCGTRRGASQGSKVRIPASLYPIVVERLQTLPLDPALQRFLSDRCDDAFLKLFIGAKPNVFEPLVKLRIEMAYSSNVHLLARIFEADLLPEHVRADVVKRITELTIEWADGSIFCDRKLRSLLTEAEFLELAATFKNEWLNDLLESVDRIASDYSSTDQASVYRDFKDTLRYAVAFFDDVELHLKLPAAVSKLDELILETEPERESSKFPDMRAPAVEAHTELIAIFEDIDGN